MPSPTKTLILAALLLTTLAYLRPPEYDEAYSIFLTTPHAHPPWPPTVFTPSDVKSLYFGPTTFQKIAQNLKTGDVHPPLYFWLLRIWRDLLGPTWFTARLLSVLITLATLATLTRLARLTATPAIPALLLCLGTYGFAYTAILARGFALAQFLLLLGVTLAFKIRHCERSEATQTLTPSRHRISAPIPTFAGLALGAATFTNYLTLFPALTALAFLARKSPKTLIPFALFLPAAGNFFLAQHDARPAPFIPFSLPHAIRLLAKDSAAAWFGGLPLYAPKILAPEITCLLILLAATTLYFIAKHRTPNTLPLAALTLSTPAGLLALGLIFNNTPIEIRYLAFSLPYLSLLIAAAAPKALQTALILTESLAIIGLAVSPLTAQPQAAAARQAAALATPATLTLLPFGNDGVGIPGPFIAAAPKTLKILLLHPNTPPNLTHQTTILLATLTPDAASRLAITQTLAYLNTLPCWHQESATTLLRAYRNTCGPHGQTINHRTD